MTVKELIAVLSKYDGDLEVVSATPETAFDRDAYFEDISIDRICESDFEVDDYHSALVFKVDGYMPERWDWDNNYPRGVSWKENKDSEP